MIDYLVSVLTEGSIFAIMALGLNVIWGWSGDFDLAFYGYVALGAYMTLVLTIGPATSPTEYILGLSLPFPIAVARQYDASARPPQLRIEDAALWDALCAGSGASLQLRRRRRCPSVSGARGGPAGSQGAGIAASGPAA